MGIFHSQATLPCNMEKSFFPYTYQYREKVLAITDNNYYISVWRSASATSSTGASRMNYPATNVISNLGRISTTTCKYVRQREYI